MKFTVQLFKTRKPQTFVLERTKHLSKEAFEFHQVLAAIVRAKDEKSTTLSFSSKQEFASFIGNNLTTDWNELIEKGFILEDKIKGYTDGECYKFYETGTLSEKETFIPEIAFPMLGDYYCVVREWKDREFY